MKKLLSLFLVFTLLVTAGFTAVAADGDVEIGFCVGDSTLIINNEPVLVETAPYVVGVGVTLVPVRVITEAFGATVGWEESTQTVSLDYPDVKISLQIGNPIAEVNGKAQELLSAPELKNGRTMVPLRFISENFGADVGYEEATKRITVSKKASSSGSATVESGVTNKRIGDSYYSWSMNNPTDMKMDYRSFDGLDTSFTYDDDNDIYIDIDVKGKNYDFDKDFINLKNSLSDYTLVKAETDTKNESKKIMYAQAKNKKYFFNIICIVTDYYIYEISGSFANETTDLRDSFIDVMSTFDTGFIGSDIYDLSNVKNGVRKFEAEHLNLSFEVPADFMMLSDEDSENEFRFVRLNPNDLYSSASLIVYSKSSVTSAKAMAEKDLNFNKDTINDQISTYRPINSVSYNGFEGYMYNYEIKHFDGTEVGKDAFFEIGDYVYNFNVTSQFPNSEGDSSVYMDKILNSFSGSAIDSAKTGTLMRNIAESTGSLTHTNDKVELKYPNNYEVATNSDGDSLFVNPLNGVTLSFSKEKVDGDLNDIARVLGEVKKQRKDDGATVVMDINKRTIHESSYQTLVMLENPKTNPVYTCYYITVRKGTAYIFVANYSELAYSLNSRREIETIIGSMKINLI